MANCRAVFDVMSKSWHGTPLPPLYNPHQSLGELLFRALQRAPTHIAQISADTGRMVTFRELFFWSVRIAQSLPAKCGVVPGDIIAVAVRNGEKVAPLVFGCFMANIVINALDPSFRVEDYDHLIGLVRPKMVVCDPDLIPVLRLVFAQLSFQPQLLVMGALVDGCIAIDDLLQPTGNEKNFTPDHLPNPPSTELAYILCSSGTTGFAKGVCLSHSACIARTTRLFDACPTDRILCFSSLYWVTGFGTLLVGTMSGATRIITRDPWSTGLTLDLIERYRVTILFLPPPHLNQMLVNGMIGIADFSSVRQLLTGGGPLPDEVKRSMERYLTHPEAAVLPCFGLTEFCGVSMDTARRYKPDSVGEVSPCVEAKIVGEDDMPLDSDQEGELLLRSDFMFLGYYGNPSATSEVLDPDGWLRTGDIARYDADGMFYIVSRKKEIMKYGGYQVSPLELEQTIFRLFGEGVGSHTRALRLVCVAGVHERGNDLPVTLAVRLASASISEQEIVDGVADVVADYKRLRGGVFFVDHLPLTSSGKIARKRCHDLALQLYKERK
ncbi:4-coumarate--CoA ligase-like 5 [Anopheles albimanus]|uniref:4-coumarate--CoA ligase-like 5 n=1 Tax=Anopheles albimanus TaxID=7167 RepID=UPI0016407841|nr:4-coumarate--CoA ligase-like 5 [Anopheles albimanus]